MRKKKFKISKIFKFILVIVLFIFIYSIGASIYEHVQKNALINEFKSRTIETVTVEKYGDVYHYHKVKRVHEYELNDTRSVFYDSAKDYPGQKGDVLLTFESPFPHMYLFDKALLFWTGGHAAIVLENNKIFQSTGNISGYFSFFMIFDTIMHKGYSDGNGLTAQIVSNYWLAPYRNATDVAYPYYGKYYRNEIIAVRPKYQDLKNDYEAIKEYSNELADKALYNYLFIVDTKYKYYCTDLVSRAFEYINSVNGTDYNLNKDGVVTTVYDLLLNDDVYITIYKETINNEIHIYYLEDL